MEDLPELEKLIDSTLIAERVRELGKKISSDYSDKNPVIIGVLNGGFIFLADLVRHITTNVRIDFIRLSSYKSGITSEQITLVNDIVSNLADEHVIIVEDIVDTGESLKYLMDHFSKKNPCSIKTCALIDKKERRSCSVEPDYTGFRIESGFVVGYGMDYDGKGRNLVDIYIMKK